MARAAKLVDNPAWLTTAVADVYDVIQAKVPPEWLPLLSRAHGHKGQIVATMKEYGCGAYGCVIPTLDSSIVLKATTDSTETEFAAKLSSTLVVPVVVEYYMVVALAARHQGQRISLLWRESANHVGNLERVLGRRGRKAVDLIHKQHKAATHALLAVKSIRLAEKVTGHGFDTLINLWLESVDELNAVPELTYVASGMKRVWNEQRIFFSDTHEGNLGLVNRNGKPTWVITDPGNVVVVSDE